MVVKSFIFDNKMFLENFDKLAVKTWTAVVMYLNTKSVQLESQMKAKRPWTDRTGMAKATLKATVSQPNTHTVQLTLSHGVSYGIWLELCNEKRYAIVIPTLNNEAPKIVNGLNTIVRNVSL